MQARQDDLFQAEAQVELLEQRPERKYTADPDAVRVKLRELLAEARAARSMPWDARTLELYRTTFPQMTDWLPKAEAEELRGAFADELRRLGVT